MQEDANRRLGRNVADLRKIGRGWSQAELARRLADRLERPFEATAVTRLESGQRSTTVNELIALADVLDVEVAALLGISSDSSDSVAAAELQRHVREAATQFRAALESISALRGTIRHIDGVLAADPDLSDDLPDATIDFLDFARTVDGVSQNGGQGPPEYSRGVWPSTLLPKLRPVDDDQS